MKKLRKKSLYEIQSDISKAIVNSDDLSAASKAKTHILSSKIADADYRLGRYQRAYAGKVERQLRYSFEAVFAALGELDARRVLRDFSRIHFSRSIDLIDMGESFVQFLREVHAWKVPAYLVDLADFEWQIMKVYSGTSKSKVCVLSEWPLYKIWVARHKSISKFVRPYKSKRALIISAQAEGIVVYRITKAQYFAFSTNSLTPSIRKQLKAKKIRFDE